MKLCDPFYKIKGGMTLKLRVEQLRQHLKTNLSPIYILSGDEPLQRQEAADAILDHAKKQGFEERQILHVEARFDWSELTILSDSLSLFSNKQLIDLRLPHAKPGLQGAKVLKHWAEHLPTDKLLLLRCGRLDYSGLKKAWLKALEKVGVLVQIWSLSRNQTLVWVRRRLQEKGFQADHDAVRLLTERVEGNLLAAAQEIEKLSLLKLGSQIGVKEIYAVVMDSSRYSLFDLTEATLSANKPRVVHIMQILREEGTAIPLLLWSLSDQVRQLANIAERLRAGATDVQALSAIPHYRQKLFQRAIRQHEQTDWSQLLQHCAAIDRFSKGRGDSPLHYEGRLWDELLSLALALAGLSLLSPSFY